MTLARQPLRTLLFVRPKGVDMFMRFVPSRLVAFILLMLVLSSTSPAQSTTDSAARTQRVENGLLPDNVIKGQPLPQMKLVDRMKYYETPGVSIALINNYKIGWARGSGVREVASNEAVTADTLFQAASISKPVTAMAALRLVQQGKLNLDEDVNKRLVTWKV